MYTPTRGFQIPRRLTPHTRALNYSNEVTPICKQIFNHRIYCHYWHHYADPKWRDRCQLLVVEVDIKPTFRRYLTAICCKAGRQINALTRISKCLNTEVKLSLFQSLTMRHFNFCTLLWHFCGVQDLKKVEKIPFSAFQYVAQWFYF